MNKIINWTFGSVFRTFGRIIAYILVGVLFSYILSKTGFKITDLFLDNVKASSWSQYWISGSTWSTDWGQNYHNNTSVGQFYTTQGTGDPSSNGGVKTYWFKFDNEWTNTNTLNEFNVVVRMKINSNDIAETSSYNNQYQCNISNTEWDHYQGGQHDTEYEYTSFTCQGYYTNSYTEYSDKHEFALSMSYMGPNGEGDMHPCIAKSSAGWNYTFTCPITTNSIKGLIFNVETKFVTTYSIGYYFTMLAEKDQAQAIIDSQNQNTQAINNQTQQQQQQHQEIMDTNSTQTESSANDLFNNSIFEESQGGLSSIITAPLVMINQMLSNTCVSPSATWKGQTISLPCGSMLWDRPNASQLKDLLNVFYGGFICYYAIRKLFLMIERMKDPTSDNIEVTDL